MTNTRNKEAPLTIGEAMTDVVLDEAIPEQRTLTYKGSVKIPERLYLGPGQDGRVWKILGAMFFRDRNETEVVVEEMTE